MQTNITTLELTKWRICYIKCFFSEAIDQWYCVNLFRKNSKENTCVGVSFLIMLTMSVFTFIFCFISYSFRGSCPQVFCKVLQKLIGKPHDGILS